MAETKGFEPSNNYILLVFQTSSLDHSDTFPYVYLQKVYFWFFSKVKQIRLLDHTTI